MELHTLKNNSPKGKRIRLGKGEGSKKGGTSGRGHKGQKSRSGYSKKIGFEGGQMPIQRRLPKYGFKNINRVEYKAVNIGTLQMLFETKKIAKFDNKVLFENGLIAKKDKVKILSDGELKDKIEVEADNFSKKAIEKIEAKEGKAIKKQ